MAVEAKLDEEKKKVEGSTDSGIQLGGATSSDLTGQATSSPQVAQANQTQEGRKGSGMGARLSNLKKYIDVNRNSGMAGKIASNIETNKSNVESNINTAQTNLMGNVQKEQDRLASGQNLIKGSKEGGLGVLEQGKTEAFTGQAVPKTVTAPDYSTYGQSADERLNKWKEFQQGVANQQKIENQSELENQIGELQKTANLGKSEEGRYQLLKDTFKKPSYSTGQQRLDQLLLQADPNESKVLSQMTENIANPTASKLEGLKQILGQKNVDISGQAEALKTDIAKKLYGDAGQMTTDYTSGKITDLGTGVISDFQKQLEANRLAKLQEIKDRQAAITKDVTSGKLSNEDYLKDLGVTKEQYTNLQNKAGLLGGINQFFKSSNIDPNTLTSNQIATNEDFARQQALSSLAGNNLGLLDESQRQGLKTDYTDLNYDQAKAVAAQKRDKEIQDVNNYYDGTGINKWADYGAWNEFNNLWNTGGLNKDIQAGWDYGYARANASGAKGNSIFDYWKNWKKQQKAAELNKKYEL